MLKHSLIEKPWLSYAAARDTHMYRTARVTSPVDTRKNPHMLHLLLPDRFSFRGGWPGRVCHIVYKLQTYDQQDMHTV